MSERRLSYSRAAQEMSSRLGREVTTQEVYWLIHRRGVAVRQCTTEVRVVATKCVRAVFESDLGMLVEAYLAAKPE